MKTRTVLSAVSRIALAAATAAAALPAVAATGDDLVQPKTLIVDKTLSKQQAEQQIRAARLYDTFWSTGDEAWPARRWRPISRTAPCPPVGRRASPGRWLHRKASIAPCRTSTPTSNR